MSNKIELCEATHITTTGYMDREVMEEIDDSRGTLRERKPKDKRCQDNRYELMGKYHYFHGEKFAELLMDLNQALIPEYVEYSVSLHLFGM